MRAFYVAVFIFSPGIVHAKEGRECNACPDCLVNQGGFYVSWPDTTKAAADWCRAHSGQIVIFAHLSMAATSRATNRTNGM